MAITILATFAAAAVLAEVLHPGVAIPVSKATLTCTAGVPHGDYPVTGTMALAWPGMAAVTSLTHMPAMERASTTETCASAKALIDLAKQSGGKLKTDVKVTLEKVETPVAAGCNLELVETVTAALPLGVVLGSERRLDLGSCD